MARKWGRKQKEKTGEDSPKSFDAGINRPGYKIDHVVVSAGKLKRPRKFDWGKLSQKQKVAVVASAVVVLGALAGLALYLTRDKPAPPVAPGPKCTYRMLEAAKPNFDAKKVAELEPQVKEIEAIPGYDQDANCLYVALTYYINISDAAKARELFGKLEKAYNPQEGYETVIVDAARTPKELVPTVEFLEKEAVRYQNIGPDGAPR
ncbi:MAG: hypothetical protein ACRD4B_07155 [Acidobacteriota bacterium]